MKASSPPRARARRPSAAETREKLNAASEAERKTLEGRLAAKLADAEKTSPRRVRPRWAMSAHRRRRRRRDRAATHGLAPDSKTVTKAVDASLKG